MSQAVSLRWSDRAEGWLLGASVHATIAPLRILIANPALLFLAALTAMLLRHPDVSFYEIDRVAFALLVAGVMIRAVVQRKMIVKVERITWPMVALTLLAMASIAGEPFDHETWSLLASKFIVPFTLFHLAGSVFTEEKSFRQFEVFSYFVLAYLTFTAIAFLIGAKSLIFPRFILDENLGFHADRARGPLLQAVANGVSLNMLGLIVLHAYRRRSIRGVKVVLVLAALPVAVLATMTRAVWLSFAASALLLSSQSNSRTLRKLRFAALLLAVAALGVVVTCTGLGGTLSDRLQEQGPVDYRQAVYAGGWEMFLERPLTGWGFHHMPLELPLHVSGYSEKVLYPHNTYLELLVEHGLLGLAIYLWLMFELWKVGRGSVPRNERHGFLNFDLHRMWPLFLGIFWLNASMVVMSYQFVNGLLFTLGGMLAAQKRRAEVAEC